MITTIIQTALDDNYNFHTMVVYGYKITSNGDKEILVHSGWYVNLGWHEDSTGARRYIDTNEEYYAGWHTVGGNTYYFRPTANVPSSGAKYSMVKGAQYFDGRYYYFDSATGIFRPSIGDYVTGAATRDAGPALEYLGISGIEESG